MLESESALGIAIWACIIVLVIFAHYSSWWLVVPIFYTIVVYLTAAGRAANEKKVPKCPITQGGVQNRN